MAFNKFGTPVAMSVTANCCCSLCATETMCSLVDSRYICANCQNGRQEPAAADGEPEEGDHVAT